MEWILIILGLGAILTLLPYIGIFAVLVILFYAAIKLKPIERFRKYLFTRFELKYYESEEFWNTRRRVDKYIKERNELNQHISELKKIQLGAKRSDFGRANYYDASEYDYSRPEHKKYLQGKNVHNCSRSVCDNARMQPFKYVCKYFDIKPTEDVLGEFENLLNNFEAAKEGIKLSIQEKYRILRSIDSDIPEKIRRYGYDRFQEQLGFRDVGLEDIEFPQYIFQYVSPGGNASMRCDVVMDIENLNKFINYLSEKIKFQKSAAGQRALMTSALRKKILQRDGYICKKCGNSTQNEPNLLLEVDHIIPISKGGLTTEDNLQTLCWKCNRAKGAKVE